MLSFIMGCKSEEEILEMAAEAREDLGKTIVDLEEIMKTCEPSDPQEVEDLEEMSEIVRVAKKMDEVIGDIVELVER